MACLTILPRHVRVPTVRLIVIIGTTIARRLGRSPTCGHHTRSHGCTACRNLHGLGATPWSMPHTLAWVLGQYATVTTPIVTLQQACLGRCRYQRTTVQQQLGYASAMPPIWLTPGGVSCWVNNVLGESGQVRLTVVAWLLFGHCCAPPSPPAGSPRHGIGVTVLNAQVNTFMSVVHRLARLGHVTARQGNGYQSTIGHNGQRVRHQPTNNASTNGRTVQEHVRPRSEYHQSPKFTTPNK